MSRVVVDTEVLVALTTPATDAPVSSSTAASSRNRQTMWAPTSPSAVEMPQYRASPDEPAARAHPLGVPADLRAPGPEPERAGGQTQRERGEQAETAGAERLDGGQHVAQDEDRAGGHSATGTP